MIQLVKKEEQIEIKLEELYNYIGISRQGVYQLIQRYENETKMVESIKDQVAEYRQAKDRLAGSRSLYHNLNIYDQFSIGISKFERLMSEHELTQKVLKIRIVTTKSCTQSWNYFNRVKELVINNINQVFAGDITYINYSGKVYYLFMLIDVFSQRIVGHHIHDRMRKIEAIKALEMAIKLRGENNLTNCIHHTDGGSQYFSTEYLRIVKSFFKEISVAKTCIENGIPEQKNGFVKNHLIPTTNAYSMSGLKWQVSKKLDYYNFERKQEGLSWLSPDSFEKAVKNGDIMKEIKLK